MKKVSNFVIWTKMISFSTMIFFYNDIFKVLWLSSKLQIVISFLLAILTDFTDFCYFSTLFNNLHYIYRKSMTSLAIFWIKIVKSHVV